MSRTPVRAAIAASAMLAFASVGVFTSSAAAAKSLLADCTKFVDGWQAAYNAKDADALAGMYDASKGTYSSVFWTGTGRDVLTQGFKQEFMSGSTMTSIKCEASDMTGDVGVSKGTWAATGKGPDGKEMAIGGHWLASYEGHDGKYLILDHTSNMQLPPPPK